MTSLLRHRLPAVVLLLLAYFIGGCATDREAREYINPGTTELLVERLELRGVESISERELRAGLATQEDPGWRSAPAIRWIPTLGADPVFFNHFAWRQDQERILAYYRQQGYFHAEIVSESLIMDPENGTVRIRVSIEENDPTRVQNLDIQGLIPDITPSADELLQGLALSENDIFVQDSYRQTRDAVQRRLRRAGHAYAVVSGRVYVNRDEATADVFFFADPGPQTTIGPVYIFGLDEIDEDAVRRVIRFREGDLYSPQALTEAQEDIFDLGVFGMVTVLPAHEARQTGMESPQERQRLEEILDEFDLEEEADIVEGAGAGIELEDDDRDVLGISHVLDRAQRHAESRSRLEPEVPIIIRAQEATGYNLRVGAGLAIESTRQDARGLLNWSSRNFLGGLRRLEHYNAAGYAWAPGLIGPGQVTNRGIILSSELRFQQPQFIESHTNLRMRPRVARDVREGYTMWHPSFRISLDRTFFRFFVVDLSYNLDYFNFFNIEESLLDPTATELGVDFQEQFFLETLEQSLSYDRRNDILAPSRGFMVNLTVQEASRFIAGGEFDYIKPILSAEGYVPINLFVPSLIAIRSRVGSVYDVGRDTGIPVQSRLYSGGTDGMRSFGRRRLSLFTATGEPVPIGGLSQFEASVEPRFRLVADLLGIGDLWGAVFLDSATVLGGQLLFDTDPNIHGTADTVDIRSSLLHGIGAGMWWNTLVGPVRVDFAYTLSNTTEDLRFRRCENPADYGTEACEFVPLEDDRIQDLILGYGIYLSIGHSF